MRIFKYEEYLLLEHNTTECDQIIHVAEGHVRRGLHAIDYKRVIFEMGMYLLNEK